MFMGDRANIECPELDKAGFRWPPIGGDRKSCDVMRGLLRIFSSIWNLTLALDSFSQIARWLVRSV